MRFEDHDREESIRREVAADASPTPCALCGAAAYPYGRGLWYCPVKACASNPKELRLDKWNALNAAIEKAKEEAVEVAGDYTGEECPVCKRHRWMKNGVWESCEKCEFVLHEDHAITLRASLDVRFASAVREAEERAWDRCFELAEKCIWWDEATGESGFDGDLTNPYAAHRAGENS